MPVPLRGGVFGNFWRVKRRYIGEKELDPFGRVHILHLLQGKLVARHGEIFRSPLGPHFFSPLGNLRTLNAIAQGMAGTPFY